MPLRSFRRQYEQIERDRIIDMMESGWSSRRVSRQLGHSDCVTSRREDHHIVRNARVQPSASSAAIQAQVAPSLGAPVSCRTIRRRLAEGHLVSRCLLRVLPLTPNHQHLPLEWCHARRNWTAAEWNKVVFSEGNPDSISAVMTIVFVCGDPGVNASILLYFTAILRSHSWCDVMGCHCLQYTVTSSINPWHHDSPVVCP
ncbi:HTH_Tnp_Tc3_2 domain-containing protein [Trichonephila clavipes]|nr:HTH_Tnp_Tc3_2 domain-containing protein [Trichonephila clavipes]